MELPQSSTTSTVERSPEMSNPGLTMSQAEHIALKNSPRVSVTRLETLVQQQIVRQDLAGALPHVVADATVAKAYTGSRVGAAASLNDSRVFTHAGMQMTVSQMITDFGYTSNLLASARLTERAKQADQQATRQEIVLRTDRIFLATIRAQGMREAARHDLAIRKSTQRQISELTGNTTQMTLDRGLADADVLKASLQFLDAEADAAAALAALDEILGLDHEQTYTLLDEGKETVTPLPDGTALFEVALKQRPDMLASNLRLEAGNRFSKAQMAQLRPTVTAIGTVGGEPVRPGQYFISSWNGAVGVNVTVPVFDGLFSKARAKEAELRASEMSEQTRLLRNHVSSDVKAARIQAQTAHQRCSLASQMLTEASSNLASATSQYQLGHATFMELNHAQLQQNEAETTNINARYLSRLADVVLAFELGEAH